MDSSFLKVCQDNWGIIVILAALVVFLSDVRFRQHVYNKRIITLEEQHKSMETDIAYLLRCSFALLDGLKQQGCNGEVTKMYSAVKDYVLTKNTNAEGK